MKLKIKNTYSSTNESLETQLPGSSLLTQQLFRTKRLGAFSFILNEKEYIAFLADKAPTKNDFSPAVLRIADISSEEVKKMNLVPDDPFIIYPSSELYSARTINIICGANIPEELRSSFSNEIQAFYQLQNNIAFDEQSYTNLSGRLHSIDNEINSYEKELQPSLENMAKQFYQSAAVLDTQLVDSIGESTFHQNGSIQTWNGAVLLNISGNMYLAKVDYTEQSSSKQDTLKISAITPFSDEIREKFQKKKSSTHTDSVTTSIPSNISEELVDQINCLQFDEKCAAPELVEYIHSLDLSAHKAATKTYQTSVTKLFDRLTQLKNSRHTTVVAQDALSNQIKDSKSELAFWKDSLVSNQISYLGNTRNLIESYRSILTEKSHNKDDDDDFDYKYFFTVVAPTLPTDDDSIFHDYL